MGGYTKALICCTALLAGCAIAPTARIPVAVSCIKAEPPPKPQTTDETELLKFDEYAATLTTWTERLTLKAYAEKADALIQACR